MSHVDEGALHAYIDGEVSAVERSRLDAHFAECAACRGRLTEERALVERAGQLLGLAAPPARGRALPPLHQLRHPRPWWGTRWPLAWAATIVLAVAAGWYARGGVGAPDSSAVPAAVGFDSAPPPRDMAARRDAAPAQRPSAGAGRAATPAAPREADRLAPAPRLARLEDRAAGPAAGAGAGAPSPLPAPAAELATGTVAAAEAKVAATASPDIAIVTGLPVRSVRQGPNGETIVEQAVDSATVITLFEWRSEPAQTAQPPQALSSRARAEAPARASERLARYVGGWRVEIAGPLPADSLNKLLEAVRLRN